MKLTLTLAFLFTAALYASVGFGGGSTYTALLAVTGVSYTLIPLISLSCNICVVSGNSFRYARAGLIKLSQIWPLLILSVPAAFIGGRLSVPEALFIGLLSLALFAAGLRMVLGAEQDVKADKVGGSKISAALIGGGIGLYSGIVGIGGGIFLAPVLYKLRWARAQEIAAVCSLFILVNSVAGLGGQILKHQGDNITAQILPYWPLILAVIIGGQFGNRFSLRFLSAQSLRRLTGGLILIVALRLFWKWAHLMGWLS